jgi:hypothetical protein
MCVPSMDVLWLKSQSWMCAPGASRRRAIVCVGDFRLFPLFSALFFPLAFSFAISMTFPVFSAP